MSNYLITGYHGKPHVTVENDRGKNAAIFGNDRMVLPVGQQLKAEYIGNNTIRLYDGKLIDNGVLAGIPVGEYVDIYIPNAGTGKSRYDRIVFQYSKDASTLVETGSFVRVAGTETSGIPTFPTLTQEDLLTNTASFDQMPLWSIYVNGGTISAPTKDFYVDEPLVDKASHADVTQSANNVISKIEGGQVMAKKASNLYPNSAEVVTISKDTKKGNLSAPLVTNGIYIVKLDRYTGILLNTDTDTLAVDMTDYTVFVGKEYNNTVTVTSNDGAGTQYGGITVTFLLVGQATI